MLPIITREAYLAQCPVRLHMPADSWQTAMDAMSTLSSDSFFDLVVELMESPEQCMDKALAGVAEMGTTRGLHPFASHMALLWEAGYLLYKQFEFSQIPEPIFWDTLLDIYTKMRECMRNHGFWGVAVATWYRRILSGDILAIGRLQYERTIFYEERFCAGGLTILRGEPCFSIHIPSIGPLTQELRTDSYRRAFRQLSPDGRPLCFICDSWLLYPPHRTMLVPPSNILSFMDDFTILTSEDYDKASDSWRLFGPAAQNPPETWPEDTQLQRAYKQRVLGGGVTGSGFGAFWFDGERIIK